MVNNLLFEYDLDPKNVFEIMTGSPQNISCYSSLIGFFYQQGIGCEVDKAKAFEIYSNAIANNQKVELSYFFSDQKNEIDFCNNNDDIESINAMILQYFYSLFLYKDVIIHRKDNYKLHIIQLSSITISCKNIKKNYNKAIEWFKIIRRRKYSSNISSR